MDPNAIMLGEVKQLIKRLGESGFGRLDCLATVDAFEAVANGELDAADVDIELLYEPAGGQS